ncbi:MAG TPA: hypothetical protein VGC47_04715 [Acidimicrobiia bacterium]|jgi:hypothetical protein
MTESTGETESATGARLRRFAAIVVVLVGLGVVVSGAVPACEENALVVGTSVEVVETCRDVSLTDGRLVVWALIGVAFVWPDISELTVGSVSVKRRLARTESEQRAIKSEVEGLHQLVQLQANQSIVVRVEPRYVNPDNPIVIAELQRAGVEARHAEVAAEVTDTETAMQLLRVHERISTFDTRYRRISESTSVIGDGGLEVFESEPWFTDVAQRWPEAIGLGAAMLAEQARAFTHNFPDTLDSVRAVRNTVAHGGVVSSDDLAKTFSLALALEEFLLDRFRLWRTLNVGTTDIGPRLG